MVMDREGGRGGMMMEREGGRGSPPPLPGRRMGSPDMRDRDRDRDRDREQHDRDRGYYPLDGVVVGGVGGGVGRGGMVPQAGGGKDFRRMDFERGGREFSPRYLGPGPVGGGHMREGPRDGGRDMSPRFMGPVHHGPGTRDAPAPSGARDYGGYDRNLDRERDGHGVGGGLERVLHRPPLERDRGGLGHLEVGREGVRDGGRELRDGNREGLIGGGRDGHHPDNGRSDRDGGRGDDRGGRPMHDSRTCTLRIAGLPRDMPVDRLREELGQVKSLKSQFTAKVVR